jgi:DNA-binding protein H-NS
MARINLNGMDVESLLSLREQVDNRLAEHRQNLQKQIDRLGAQQGGRTKLKGVKVAPKYRSKKDPALTWAGRGATPLWMRDEMKAGKLKKEAFLIK